MVILGGGMENDFYVYMSEGFLNALFVVWVMRSVSINELSGNVRIVEAHRFVSMGGARVCVRSVEVIVFVNTIG